MATGVTMLLRVCLLVATCAVWVLAQEDENVIPDWLFASGEEEDDTTRIITTRKPKEWVRGGTSCLNSDECGRGKCCLRRNRSPRRRCRRYQRIDEPCTEEQMMGGYYYGHCPCNKNGVCMYKGGALRCVKKKVEQQPLPPRVPTPPPEIPGQQPGLGHKQDSQESGEVTGKPPVQNKPTGGTSDNEIPELPFETLAGPGENSNAILPFIFQGGGNRFPVVLTRPPATAPVDTSSNSIHPPIPGTNNAGHFGQGPNVVPPAAPIPPHGGIGTQGQFARPELAATPSQPPNALHVSGPPSSAHDASLPSSLPSPASPENISPQLGGPGNSPSPASTTTGNNGLSTIDQEPRTPGLPASHLATGNSALPPSAEQVPSRSPLSSSPITTGSNGLPPIDDEGPPPPPLPPSPLSAGNNGLPGIENQLPRPTPHYLSPNGESVRLVHHQQQPALPPIPHIAGGNSRFPQIADGQKPPPLPPPPTGIANISGWSTDVGGGGQPPITRSPTPVVN